MPPAPDKTISSQMSIETHYDRLKVSRDAPPEVIKAAYRSLCLLYHPDRNNDDSDSEELIKSINLAYATLSDPEKRREHDRWIANVESVKQDAGNGPTHRRQAKASHQAGQGGGYFQEDYRYASEAESATRAGNFQRNWNRFLAVVVLVTLVASSIERLVQQQSRLEVALAAPTAGYAMSLKAPNGKLWPMTSSYIDGAKMAHADGQSLVTVDNSQSESEVHALLVSLDGEKPAAVREFFIKAYGKFTLIKVNAGNYEIRYRNLGDGKYYQSEPFHLTDSNPDDGVKFSNISVPLFNPRRGETRLTPLPESGFIGHTQIQ